MAALCHFFEAVFHIITKIIEPIFIIGAIGNIAVIGCFTLISISFMIIDTANCHAQELINLTHPFGISGGEIVIYGDDVHAFAR